MQPNVQTTNEVKVLACGYREIKSAKSGLTFPAFLVSLPLNEADNNVRIVWRSKRDFLLLGRASSLSLPKAALKKLAESTPWKRPGTSIPTIEGHIENHYHARMKKSLLQLDQFLQGSCRCDDAKESWELFCRPGDTEGLVTVSIPELPTNTVTTSQKSSRLGQYFCSKENAQKVVHLTLNEVKDLLFIEKKDHRYHNRPLLFLEPSCGHGDIVQELLNQLQQHYTSTSNRNRKRRNVSIHGYDIDPNAIQKCQSISSSSNAISIHWTCQNFLESSNTVHDEPFVICLGGPPYTTGAGSNENIKRDLPSQFISHCINEFNALVVSFLLPIRYRESLGEIVSKGYEQESHELPSSTFFFQGSTAVTQPSIIKLLYNNRITY